MIKCMHTKIFQNSLNKSVNCLLPLLIYRNLTTYSIKNSAPVLIRSYQIRKLYKYLSPGMLFNTKFERHFHNNCVPLTRQDFLKFSKSVHLKYIKCMPLQFYSQIADSSDSESLNPELNNVQNSLYKNPGTGHNVLIIQPRNKEKEKHESKSVAELKLSEAASLIKTLIGWKVMEMHIIPTASSSSSLVFGKGNLEKLKSIVRGNSSITAIFVGIDVLTALQNAKLEEYFKIQVFDRYQIILQIFHEHAHTKEAKLQLALAEIPYLRIKLAGYFHTRDSSTFSGIHHVGGEGETFTEIRRRLLNEREIKLKKELDKIKNQREFLRKSDSRNAFPVVAVVGYTNCGKTTLIKSLTNDSKLLPEDKLFATLDVTLHSGLLPSNQKVLYIDTVGFISDVPTSLIQSFRSTLEEISLADLVIHVRDMSNPNTEAQKKTVLKTLEELNLSQKLLDSIVEVKNKIDLVNNSDHLIDSDSICISATEGTGLTNLLEQVEEKILKNTGSSICLLRVPNGGEEYRWILKEAAVRDAMADQKDPNYLILEIVISSSSLSKFKHNFGDLTIKVEDLEI